MLGKAKSSKPAHKLWRGTFAIPAPFLLKRQLRVGAKGMTRFLRYLKDEVPCNFPVHGVKDVGPRWHALTELNITHISEVETEV